MNKKCDFGLMLVPIWVHQKDKIVFEQHMLLQEGLSGKNITQARMFQLMLYAFRELKDMNEKRGKK